MTMHRTPAQPLAGAPDAAQVEIGTPDHQAQPAPMHRQRIREAGDAAPNHAAPDSERDAHHKAMHLHSLIKAARHLVDGLVDTPLVLSCGLRDLMTAIEERADELSVELEGDAPAAFAPWKVSAALPDAEATRPDTPILRLMRGIEEIQRLIQESKKTGNTDAEAIERLDWDMSVLEVQMFSQPSVCAADMAAKMLVAHGFGEFSCLCETHPVWAEARAALVR